MRLRSAALLVALACAAPAVRGERYYDERGRLTRERELAAGGTVVRDDEVFEDGSRTAFAR
jgi:hypothetical protein